MIGKIDTILAYLLTSQDIVHIGPIEVPMASPPLLDYIIRHPSQTKYLQELISNWTKR